MANSDSHIHDHGHPQHSNTDGTTFAERNRAYWNKQASAYMSDEFQKQFDDLLNKVTAFILSNITWIGIDFLDPASSFESPQGQTRSVRVLDYACGPGTITSALTGYASEYIGIDLSEKMVEEYNKRLSGSGTHEPGAQPINAHATVGNLLAPGGPPISLAGPEFMNFDLVAVGLGFHHFENLDEVMNRLVARVKPSGVLMIVDFLPHAKNDLDNGKNADLIPHHGFTEETVQKLFEGAGLVDVDLRIMSEPVVLRGKAPRTVFIARGRKPT